MHNNKTEFMDFCTEYLYSEYDYDNFSYDNILNSNNLNDILDYLIIGSELNPDKVNQNNYSNIISNLKNIFKHCDYRYCTNIPYDIVNKHISVMMGSVLNSNDGEEIIKTEYACLSNGEEIRLYAVHHEHQKIDKKLNDYIIGKYYNAYNVFHFINEMLYSGHNYDKIATASEVFVTLSTEIPILLTALCLCDKSKVNNNNLNIVLKVFEESESNAQYDGKYDTTVLKNYLKVDKESKGRNIALSFKHTDDGLLIKVTDNYIFNTNVQPHQDTNLNDYGLPQHTNHNLYKGPFRLYKEYNIPSYGCGYPPGDE